MEQKIKRKSRLWHLAWIVPLLVVDFFLVRWLASRQQTHLEVDAALALATNEVVEADVGPPPPPPPIWQFLTPPTPQQGLLTPDEPGVLQPTGSGRLESAKFGSTRTGQRNGKLFPVFHEGVDIAATERDRKGAATDPVFAVADGRVAFINSIAGNSSYGKYIVLEHPDPSLGVIPQRDGTEVPATIYTLYAHLADIRFGIRSGMEVKAGDIIGTMGATSNTRPPIPLNRSHLHWEIGLMLNGRYDRRSREMKAIPDFGNYNGQNLFGLDPLDFYANHANDPGLTMAAYLEKLEPAYEVVLRGKTPNFFSRYPALWKGEPPDGSPIWLAVSEGGLPIAGRNATEEEKVKIGNARHVVISVHTPVLGRNSRGYISQGTAGKWQFTEKGKQWAELLFY
ncbi:MAG: M23 family metallopeptidase [Verrucomicrobiota bacterium]|jgi:murein DD-endopeptidase MepM/ murein hydrolase activator NlpD|nr:M23 family metallopeptidase [Verrucomicrobiota bacterium]